MATQYTSDNAVQFEQSKIDHRKYPANVIRTETFGYALESYRKRLDDERLFDTKKPLLGFIDLLATSTEFHKSRPLRTLGMLESEVDEEDVAPFWRLVFIQSASSRGPLCCTREQLTFLLTYYQVMPSFLDFIFTFKKRTKPVAYASFRHENYLEKNGPPLELPELGRSGRQIQHAFNILSVERASDIDEKNQWPLRQVAIYHSFDVTNGRCVWIVLKGNQMMAKRIDSMLKSHKSLQTTTIKNIEGSFMASLQLHMIVLEWCTESWSEYIDYLEHEVGSGGVEAKVTPVENIISSTNLETTFSSKTTMPHGIQKQRSSALTSPIRGALHRSSSDIFRVFTRFSSLGGSNLAEPENNTHVLDVATTAADQVQNDAKEVLEGFNKEFSFKKLQRLSLLGEEIEQALMVIEQNQNVLKAIKEQYHEVIDSYGFTTYINKDNCQSPLATFFGRIKSIGRDLGIHHCRLEALLRALENDKTMFSAILQYKSERTSEFFASSAKMSSDRMEQWTTKLHDIAVRTEQETVSMHVITIFTLIFLPGTFIATLFSSGIFRWDEDGSLGSDWVLRVGGLKLFCSVSFPMMFIVLAVWSLMYLIVRRRRRGVHQEPLLPLVQGRLNEKASPV